MQTIKNTLGSLSLSTPTTVANLTMVPLVASDTHRPDYITLDAALAEGVARVTEVSESGAVPQLLVKNDAARPLLIIDGEELVGAKQNRIVNLTILVPARSTIEIPVTCVEAGRWHHTTHAFHAAGRAHYAAGRSAKLMQVTESLRRSGMRHADQGVVWDDIAAKSVRMGAVSHTAAAAVMYEQARRSLDEFEESLRAADGQVGAVFVINGVIAGLDVFDAPATWQTSMRKLVQSYGLDAVDRLREPKSDHGVPDPQRFVEAVGSASGEEFQAVGLGLDVRLRGGGIAGAALVVDGRVVHLVAFPARNDRPFRRRDYVG